jgi:transcription termination/antitermination protein NusA
MISKNFFDALEAISFERGLDIDEILQKVELAVGAACRNAEPPFNGEIIVEFYNDKKKIRVYEEKTVVDQIDPTGPKGQILLEDAKLQKDRVRVGSVIRREINLDTELGRKPASIFKQVFTQGLKDLEREKAFQFFKDRENEIITVKVNKVTEDFVTFNMGMNTESFMPAKESIPGEALREGQDVKVYITRVEKTGKGPKVFVSRATRDIVKRLFELTIPEIASGDVEIMAIARDAGSRTKVGVMSNSETVDPKGACVGMQGSRIKIINEALNNERIDIFTWKFNAVDLIAEALTPARAIAVLANEKEKTSVVIVPDDQFSLAIGRGGQNAKLASYATGWKIDIKDESTAIKEGIKFTPNVNMN